MTVNLRRLESILLAVLVSSCGQPKPPTELNPKLVAVPLQEEAASWIVYQDVHPMTDEVLKSAEVKGLVKGGEDASLLYICGPSMELFVIKSSAFIGSGGHNVGYRIDGGEAAYVSSSGNDPHSTNIRNKTEFKNAIVEGAVEIVVHVNGDHPEVMSFPLYNAVNAIHEVDSACPRD